MKKIKAVGWGILFTISSTVFIAAGVLQDQLTGRLAVYQLNDSHFAYSIGKNAPVILTSITWISCFALIYCLYRLFTIKETSHEKTEDNTSDSK